MVHVNGKKVGGNDAVTKFIAYVSPYFVVSNGGAYTKHIYAASQRIASKLGNEDGFGADPRRVEMAGGKKISDFQKDKIGARFEELGYRYNGNNQTETEKDSTMDSEEEEKLIFFYHPDHLGSTSYVTDADGNIAQHIEYIPYGEVFVEERNNSFSTNYLFNAKELDNETGLYYYGARYLDPTGAMWLSVDPLFEKYAGMSPYNYCAGNPVVMVDPDGRDIRIHHQEGDPYNGYGPITEGHISKEMENNLIAFASTPSGYSFLSKYAKAGYKIGDVTFTEDGPYSNHILDIYEYDAPNINNGSYEAIKGENCVIFVIKLNQGNPNKEEGVAITTGHELFIHMDNHDTEAILEFLSGNFDSYKSARKNADNEKKEEDHIGYATNQEKYTKRMNQYFQELKGLKTKDGNKWFDTKKLNNAKKYHDEKNKRFLQK